LQKGDVLYAFTDGYSDQFGGLSGKKFKRKQLLELLSSIHSLPMKEQNVLLSEKFHSWKGELEQLDDILIAGIRI
jgi:serine phosphatase RsbU (regulator of sigma subunit)